MHVCWIRTWGWLVESVHGDTCIDLLITIKHDISVSGCSKNLDPVCWPDAHTGVLSHTPIVLWLDVIDFARMFFSAIKRSTMNIANKFLFLRPNSIFLARSNGMVDLPAWPSMLHFVDNLISTATENLQTLADCKNEISVTFCGSWLMLKIIIRQN